MTTTDITTEDGKVVRPGDRVFDYYGCKWGVIEDDVDDQGWFHVTHDDGSRSLLNGQRIATYKPGWMK